MIQSYDREVVKRFITFFTQKGINRNGIAGMLGNVYAESRCYTNNLQNSYNTKFNMTDAEFTKRVDNGSFNFLTTAYTFGYGLCQWTSIGRRTGLYTLCKQKGTSIADAETQFEWLWTELNNGYKKVLAELTNPNNTVRSCAEIFVVKFEVPGSVIKGGADKEKCIDTRAEYAQEFYDEFLKEETPKKILIAISAGHYYGQAGKRCDKALDIAQTREWTLNSRIANRVQYMLSAYDDVETVRLDDISGSKLVELKERSTKANNLNADFYLAIHHNAGAQLTKAGGVVVYCKPGMKEEATLLYNSVVSRNGLKGNRSRPIVETTDLHEVREPKMKSMLIENGFMDSLTDTPIILKDSYAESSAEGIVAFFVERFGLKQNGKSEEKAVPSSFKVRVTASALNIRLSYSALSSKTGCITDKGVYTIVDTHGDWGKLKSGMGWINLKYTQRL